jgi:hypothetical protein
MCMVKGKRITFQGLDFVILGFKLQSFRIH